MRRRLRIEWGLALAALPLFFLFGTTRPSTAQDAPKVKPTDAPLLWRIEGEVPSFLFGTIHLPDERVLALAPVVREALDATEALYTEIPFDPATQASLAPKLMLPEGETLEGVLPKDLFQRVEGHIQARGLPTAPFMRLKVWALSSQLSLLDNLQDFMTRQPLDQYLYLQAQSAGKQVGALETPDEQFAALEAFTADEQIELLRQTLDQIDALKKKGEGPLDALLEAYLRGDAEALNNMMYEQMDPESELTKKFVQKVLVERNQRMAERIERMVKEGPGVVRFFAVGALHYPRPDGILALLRARGFTVTRIGPKDAGKVAPVPAGAGAGK